MRQQTIKRQVSLSGIGLHSGEPSTLTFKPAGENTGIVFIKAGEKIEASLENVSLWHERDISHSSVERIIIPDSCLALDYMLNKFIYVIEKLVVYPENMLINLVKLRGLIFSQRVMLELMDKGLKIGRAHV